MPPSRLNPTPVPLLQERNPLLTSTFFSQDFGTNDWLLNARAANSRRGINYRSGAAPTEGASNAEENAAAAEKGEGAAPQPRRSFPRREGSARVTRTVEVDGRSLGRLIGYKGATIKAMGEKTATRMWFSEVEGSDNKLISIQGETDAVAAGEELVKKVLQDGPSAHGLPEAPVGEERPRGQFRGRR